MKLNSDQNAKERYCEKHQKEAEVVKRIFREYVDGKGVAAICKALERDGIKTISGKAKWHDSVI